MNAGESAIPILEKAFVKFGTVIFTIAIGALESLNFESFNSA